MARRLAVSAANAGASTRAADHLERAFSAAIDRRAAAIADPAHHAFLHPARTTLILMDDAGVSDAAALAAAPLVESFDPPLRWPAAAAAALLGDAAAAFHAEVPLPAARDAAAHDDGEDDALLLEQLVTARREPCLVALSEHLDQARHLHFRLRTSGSVPGTSWPADPDAAVAAAAAFHRRARAVYLPVARRTHPRLAARLERWAGAFQRRFLDAGR